MYHSGVGFAADRSARRRDATAQGAMRKALPPCPHGWAGSIDVQCVVVELFPLPQAMRQVPEPAAQIHRRHTNPEPPAPVTPAGKWLRPEGLRRQFAIQLTATMRSTAIRARAATSSSISTLGSKVSRHLRILGRVIIFM